jgi:hypothetical protein
MIASVRSLKVSFSSARSSASHTAYSSAVRAVLVVARHCARTLSPSQMAKTMLVLPASMARSI